MPRHAIRTTVFFLSALAVSLWTARTAHAQAWVPPKGEGTVSIIGQDSFVRNHYYSDHAATPEDVGHIRSDAMLMSISYGLTGRIAVSLSLPYIASRYVGIKPHQLPIDDGNYHGTLQDLRFDMLYSVARGRFAITPFVSTIVPSRDYEYFGHSAAGRHVSELQVGAYVGRLVGRAFVQGKYAYGLTERIQNIIHDRNMLDLEAGYFIKPSLRAFVLASGQATRGGKDVPSNARTALGTLWPFHDQLARDQHVNLGVGASWAASKSIDLFGSFVRTAVMRNGHALSHSVSIGIAWTFAKGERARAQAAADHAAMGADCPMDASKKTSLSKCLCLKGQ